MHLSNLLMPPLLFFLLGFAMRLTRSEFEIPSNFVKVLSIYLMIGIGLHGGMQLAQHHLLLSLKAIVVAVGLGVFQTMVAYGLVRYVWRVEAFDSASIAAHYGSVSLATFLTAVAFLKSQAIDYESYPFIMLAVMEAPGIFVGLFLAQYIRSVKKPSAKSAFALSHKWDIFAGCLTNESVMLLLGSMLIGYLSLSQGKEALLPFYTGIFQGVLSLFLLAMGTNAAQVWEKFKKIGLKMILFALLTPILGGVLGILTAYYVLDFGVGGCVLVASLCASASYIAVPPAMQLAIPEAHHSVALTLSLGVTFPFNVVFGIPFYTYLVQLLFV